jgi:solute carrier family 38 (sodium-coupled neutral amino acid transporter), member 10
VQYFILLPISLPRELGSITYLSALGLMSSIFLMFAVTFEFFTNKRVVTNFESKFRATQLLIIKWESIIETVPFIVFLYMYQSLIP